MRDAPDPIDRERYREEYARSLEDPEAYWAGQAEALLDWETPWRSVMTGSFDAPETPVRWFEGGRLSVAANCIDRHLATRSEQTALIWVPDDAAAASSRLTYREIHRQICRFANVLLAEGVKPGDVVTLYLPMIPEAVIAMLACARIGAVHSVVFAGFSPESLKSRIADAGSRLVITADEGLRGGRIIPCKSHVDRAVSGTGVERVIVVRRTGGDIGWNDGRDRWWHALRETVSAEHVAEAFDAEHPLFLLYTSGSTGTPKGLQHSSAGYLLHAAQTFRDVFDYRHGEVFWCTADIGWITGHSYLVYGPLAMGATTVMFEGTPTHPDAGRMWEIASEQQVSIVYTAPTLIRMLMREGDRWIEESSLRRRESRLRVLGSVGEPINPEAWRWYRDVVGDGRARVVDTWWQTETGGHMIAPLPYAGEAKPGAAMTPFFGIAPELRDPATGQLLEGEAEGALCIARPWPGLARTIFGDHDRYVETYFKPFPGSYFSGDAARRDADGDYWIAGRMDDVINVSGHRIGTAEIESALVLHPAVTEAAVVGISHPIKGQDIYAYVTTLPAAAVGDGLAAELKQWVRREIGAHAAPGVIHFTPDLPKTRSGKIMRRILRKIAAGEVRGPEDYGVLGDISTLLDPSVVDSLVASRQ